MLRIDGDLAPLPTAAIEHDSLLAMLHPLMNNTQQQQLAEDLSIDFAYACLENARFRVNIYYQQRGIAATFRVIATQTPTLETLQLPAVFRTLAEKQHGLIVITGATGSGKSSSLAALIDYINTTQARHIISIEDPIECIHAPKKCLISQREVPTHTPSFPKALRAALREDPDVICVAELRDIDTIRLALTAAETGHLVLATLHTPSAPKTLDRIIDVFPGNEKDTIRMMLSGSLQAVVAQRLIKHSGGGRRAIFEILLATPAIQHMIRENKIAQIYSAMQTGQALGMCTFNSS